MRVKQLAKNPVKTSTVHHHHEEEEEAEEKVAQIQAAKAKKPKTIALQKTAGKGGGGSGKGAATTKPVRDKFRIPNKTVRRFALRSGSVRCAADVYPVANETLQKTIDEVILLAMRSMTHDGRLTIKSRDVKRAMRVMNIRLY